MNLDLVQYYRQPAILRRILEFCGLPPQRVARLNIDPFTPLSDSAELMEMLNSATNEYIAVYGPKLLEIIQRDHASMKSYMLGWALDNTLDVHRSVWDRKNAVGVLDIEYFSKNYPAEPYVHPERTFVLLEPVYQGILDILKDYSLLPIVIATGQGYNLDFRLSKREPTFKDLIALGYIEETLRYDYSHPSPRRGRPVPEEDAKAFDAIGKLIEFLSHRILRELQEFSPTIPLVIGDIVCGNERREAISFDLSLYANPLHKRSFRCPFSTYSKHLVRKSILGEAFIQDAAPLFCIPRQTREAALSLVKILKVRRKAEAAIDWAETVTTSIPSQPQGYARLIEDYKKSPLYSFHREYDAVKPDDPSSWPRGYDLLDLDALPPCIAQVLMHPNPLLLQPTNLRAVVRILMAMGWHPKHIAGLITSKYQRDFGWEVDFNQYDANRWANVWVRIYAGLIVGQVDGLLDFNCVSHQEKGEAWMGMRFCPAPDCRFNLADYCRALQARR